MIAPKARLAIGGPPVTSVLTRIDVVVERSLICAPQFCADMKSLYMAGSHHAPNCAATSLLGKDISFQRWSEHRFPDLNDQCVIVRKPLAGSSAGPALFFLASANPQPSARRAKVCLYRRNAQPGRRGQLS